MFIQIRDKFGHDHSTYVLSPKGLPGGYFSYGILWKPWRHVNILEGNFSANSLSQPLYQL